MAKRIVLADPRGFCAGVDRAILTVQTILKAASARVDGLPPVYVRRQIVHNRHVVEDLAAQGAVFVQELAEIPDEAAAAGIPIVFSAHGVSSWTPPARWSARCIVRYCVSCAKATRSSTSAIGGMMRRSAWWGRTPCTCI